MESKQNRVPEIDVSNMCPPALLSQATGRPSLARQRAGPEGSQQCLLKLYRCELREWHKSQDALTTQSVASPKGPQHKQKWPANAKHEQTLCNKPAQTRPRSPASTTPCFNTVAAKENNVKNGHLQRPNHDDKAMHHHRCCQDKSEKNDYRSPRLVFLIFIWFWVARRGKQLKHFGKI